MSALRHIRGLSKPDETIPLWIDGICIDQKDMQDRKGQVAAMRRIYEKSAVFITWLGIDHSADLD